MPKDYFAMLSIGSILFLKEKLSFMFAINYDFRNPNITYEIPGCEPPFIDEKYTEKVNLNALLWSIGVNVNF